VRRRNQLHLSHDGSSVPHAAECAGQDAQHFLLTSPVFGFSLSDLFVHAQRERLPLSAICKLADRRRQIGLKIGDGLKAGMDRCCSDSAPRRHRDGVW